MNATTPTLVVLCILSATANMSPAQQLWRGTSVGMTEEQVKAAIPGVVKPEAPSKFGGTTESLRFPGVEVAKIPFEAGFCFKDGRLRQVSLLGLGRIKALRAQYEARILGLDLLELDLAVWKRKATEGDPEVQSRLAFRYNQGRGVAKDDAEAVKWWRKAAEQNSAEAQYNLGICYHRGRGVAKDYTEAVKWYRKAAGQNHAEAQLNLGACYAAGEGVVKDEVEAYRWWLLAGAQGDNKAKRNASMFELMLSREGIVEGKRRVDAWLEQRKTNAPITR